MNNVNLDMLTVENLLPHLRKSYGHRQKIGREKALRGVAAGIYKIVNDPLEPKDISVKVAEQIKKASAVFSNKLISIIILTMNQLHYTKICIESILKYTRCNYQLVVIDNASTDNTVEWIKSKLRSKDILICNKENKGFSCANNQGLLLAQGEYVLFLNNDIEVLGDLWLNTFLKTMEHYDIVGPNMRKLFVDSNIFIYAGDGTEKDCYHYLEAWCLFGKAEVFKALRGFDERFYPAYSEDADLSFFALSKGYKLKEIKNDKIKHFGNRTSQTLGHGLNILSTRNRKKLYQKWIDDDIRNICLIREGARGDVLMCTPIIRELKEKYPNANIYFRTKSPELIVNNPYISQIISEPINKAFDIEIELKYEKFPGQVRIDSMANQARVKLKSRKMEVFFQPVEIWKNKKYIVIHTGLSWPNRMWLIDRWKKLCEKIIDKYQYKICFVGDQWTELPKLNNKNVINACNRTWAYVAGLLKGANFFLGIDSAVSNVAKAIGCRAYIFYGCVNPTVMVADADEIPLIDSNLDCFGCRDKVNSTYVECIKDKPYCLTNITVDEVFKIITRKERK